MVGVSIFVAEPPAMWVTLIMLSDPQTVRHAHPKEILGIRSILVTGGTGSAGPALVRELVKSGYQVRVLSRQKSSDGCLPSEAETIQGSICCPQTLELALKDIDAVFHLAALLHDTRGVFSRKSIWRTNVYATENLARLCHASGVKRLIFFSTVNVYGPTPQGVCVDETAPTRPDDLYAESKLAAEERLRLSAPFFTGLSITILRVGAVYGPRMKGNYPRLIQYLRKGGRLIPGDGTNYRTLIYDTDLAKAAQMVMEAPCTRGRIYNVTGPEPCTFNEIITAICSGLGRPPSLFHIPEWSVNPLLKVEAVRGLPLPALRLIRACRKQMESVYISGQRLKKETGYSPDIDLSTGWRNVISTMESRIDECC